MSTTTTTETQLRESMSKRVRQAATGVAFAVMQLKPKIEQLRRNPRTWLLVRVGIGALGAALVVLPLSFGNFLILPVLGLAMFLAAVMLPPSPHEVSDEEIAHELGARLVLEGGDYQAGSVLGFPAKIFLGADEIWVLDPMHRTLAVIPVAEIGSANAEETDGKWAFRVCWKDGEALFAYDSVFAERLAKMAQDAVRNAMQTAVLPRVSAEEVKARAASA